MGMKTAERETQERTMKYYTVADLVAAVVAGDDDEARTILAADAMINDDAAQGWLSIDRRSFADYGCPDQETFAAALVTATKLAGPAAPKPPKPTYVGTDGWDGDPGEGISR